VTKPSLSYYALFSASENTVCVSGVSEVTEWFTWLKVWDQCWASRSGATGQKVINPNIIISWFSEPDLHVPLMNASLFLFMCMVLHSVPFHTCFFFTIYLSWRLLPRDSITFRSCPCYSLANIQMGKHISLWLSGRW
jgi:hypothetical protein